MKLPSETRKAIIYDKLHKFTVVGILGVSLVTAVILGYNAYLFKKEGAPMLIEKYRAKAEEGIELKQREALYLEERKRNELAKKL